MSRWTLEDSFGVRWLTVSRGRLVRAGLIVGSMAVAVFALNAAAPANPYFASAILLTDAVLSVTRPDSWRALVGVAFFGLVWLVRVPDVSIQWALVAALALLVFHLVVAEASAGPPGLETGPATVLTWLLHGGLVGVAAVVVAVVAVAAQDRVASPQALLGATLLCLVAVVWVVREPR